MQDLTHGFADAQDDETSGVFGQGPEKIVVNAAKMFCIAFAFIVPNLLLIQHVWGF